MNLSWELVRSIGLAIVPVLGMLAAAFILAVSPRPP
jgi:hypothetical protein